MSDIPITIGRIVLYRTKAGGNYQVPAIVTCTAESWEAGHYEDCAPAALIRSGPVNAQGQIWVPAQVGPPSPGHAHLYVFSPGIPYVEHNVSEGDGPQQWSWPPRV